ncbi:unnamed protein product [Vitrella brassicaformis CCMP3155]|uniref:DNA polymerase eta n=2 Tax=Vitrella brassicaformis TaxID=1169539 RepID=A0A0G4ETT1_VITBC|nr:unnamed protein product [Vitrella brassicaformis CCMP3155]|eukprot:CEM01468.1 unnamed protein product [Vitrella brassicaformis CCMP3155]
MSQPAGGRQAGGRSLNRVVAHLDLDAFYCQVEHRRLNIARDVPLAVQQWDGLIAVNYPARAAGVRRGDRTAVAKGKCPDLVLVHVETISSDGRHPGSDDPADRHDRQREKVSLDRYRTASAEIMAIFSRHCPKVERASIDEAYLDLTQQVQAELKRVVGGGGPSLAELVDAEGTRDSTLLAVDGSVLDVDKVSLDSPEASLVVGAVLIARLRKAVLDETQFTVSAGISHNKMLSKQASAKHKPNRQTLVPTSSIDDMMGHLPLRDVRGLGGKLGEAVSRVFPDATTAKDLQAHSLEELKRTFNDGTGTWLWRVCRGMDDEQVSPNLKPKSLLAFKSFRPVRKMEDLERWLGVLAEEVCDRMQADTEAHRRRAKTLMAQHRGLSGAARSRSGPMPRGKDPHGLLSKDELVAAGLALLRKLPEDELLPCSRIGMGAQDFEDIDSQTASITSYFKPAAATAAAAPAPAKDHHSSNLQKQQRAPKRPAEPEARKSEAAAESASASFASKKMRTAAPIPAAAAAAAAAADQSRIEIDLDQEDDDTSHGHGGSAGAAASGSSLKCTECGKERDCSGMSGASGSGELVAVLVVARWGLVGRGGKGVLQ